MARLMRLGRNKVPMDPVQQRASQWAAQQRKVKPDPPMISRDEEPQQMVVEPTQMKYLTYQDDFVYLGKPSANGGLLTVAWKDLHFTVERRPNLQRATLMTIVKIINWSHDPPKTIVQPQRILCLVYTGYVNQIMHLKIHKQAPQPRGQNTYPVWDSLRMPEVLICVSRCDYDWGDSLRLGLVIPRMHPFLPMEIKGKYIGQPRVVWNVQYSDHIRLAKFWPQISLRFPEACSQMYVRIIHTKSKHKYPIDLATKRTNRGKFLKAVGHVVGQLLAHDLGLNVNLVQTRDEWELAPPGLGGPMADNVIQVFQRHTAHRQYFLLGVWHEFYNSGLPSLWNSVHKRVHFLYEENYRAVAPDTWNDESKSIQFLGK